MNVQIVSFYTPEYKDEAKRLAASCRRFLISHEIEEVESLGSWQANTQLKADYLLTRRRELRGPLVWLDADAEIVRYPTAFDLLYEQADIAVHYRHDAELLNGTIWLADNEQVEILLASWVKWNQLNPLNFDQRNLATAIIEPQASGDLKVHRLPPEYAFIFDTMKRDHPEVDPVILHHQASRRLKDTIGP